MFSILWNKILGSSTYEEALKTLRAMKEQFVKVVSDISERKHVIGVEGAITCLSKVAGLLFEVGSSSCSVSRRCALNEPCHTGVMACTWLLSHVSPRPQSCWPVEKATACDTRRLLLRLMVHMHGEYHQWVVRTSIDGGWWTVCPGLAHVYRGNIWPTSHHLASFVCIKSLSFVK